MEKRLIVAIALSILVIVLFQRLLPQPKVESRPIPSSSLQAKRASGPISSEIASSAPSAPPRNDDYTAPAAKKETLIETEKFILTFTNIGGSLKDIRLKEYADSETKIPLQLVADAEGERAIFSMKSAGLADSLDRQIFTLTEKRRDKVVYTFSMPERFSITKEYNFHKSNDYIELRLYIRNLGNATIYRDYDLLGPSGLRSTGQLMGRRFFEIDSMIDGKIVRNARVKNGEQFTKGIISWTGVKARYFCIILKPLQDSEGVILQQFDKNILASGVRSKRMPVYPGAIISDTYILYAGPNDIKRLKSLGFGLEQIINYGIFGGISKILLATLRTFHKVTRNWGVAIIMLTFMINIILFPLTRKSFLSMKKIQEVQPHIEKLRKVHKDNPQKLNKELAEVYRQYNINPLGGCLPLLLQMPIFIALYQGLMRSIELKGASFLWIKDLSSPDYVHLPFKLPLLGNQIHILPLLMVVAMFLQQMISTKSASATSPEQKQQQKVMLIFFPLFFGFLFYKFPSGLVLYWLTNTVLMVIEHSAMRRARS